MCGRYVTGGYSTYLKNINKDDLVRRRQVDFVARRDERGDFLNHLVPLERAVCPQSRADGVLGV